MEKGGLTQELVQKEKGGKGRPCRRGKIGRREVSTGGRRVGWESVWEKD